MAPYFPLGNEDAWADKCVSDPLWLGNCLKRIGRFGGQHPTATVLAHSLDVFERMASYDPQYRLWALYHDAHELLTGDIPRSVKHYLGVDFQYWNSMLDIKLAYRLGVDLQEVTPSVQRHDKDSGDRECLDFANGMAFRVYTDRRYTAELFEMHALETLALVKQD